MGRAEDGLRWRKQKWFLLATKVVPTESSKFKGRCLGSAINTFPQINSLPGWEQGLTPMGSINTEKLKAPQRRGTKVYIRGI